MLQQWLQKEIVEYLRFLSELLVADGGRGRRRAGTANPKSCEVRLHVHYADVDPSRPNALVEAINSAVDGIQIDLDDGFAPSPISLLVGWENYSRCSNWTSGPLRLVSAGETLIETNYAINGMPDLWLRPRPWCLEDSIFNLPAPVVDFGIAAIGTSGPLLLYLPKIRNTSDATKWARLFSAFNQKYEERPLSVIVLIETKRSLQDVDLICAILRPWLVALNTGLYDYAANSIWEQNEPAPPPELLLQSPMMKMYCVAVAAAASRNGIPWTGGMVSSLDKSYDEFVLEIKIRRGPDLQNGASGFLICDPHAAQAARDVLSENWTISRTCVPVSDENMTIESYQGPYQTKPLLRALLQWAWRCIEERTGAGGGAELTDSATAEMARAVLITWIRSQCVSLEEILYQARMIVDEFPWNSRVARVEFINGEVRVVEPLNRPGRHAMIDWVMRSVTGSPKYLVTCLFPLFNYQLAKL